MKKKLFLLLCTLLTMIGVQAQTDVTSTYLTNADFEGSYSSYEKPKSDRDIYQPNGWNVSYTNGETNDLTSLNSSCTQWSNFSGRPQPASGGNNVYWARFRWGESENLTLSQNTKDPVPAGTYCLSADTYLSSTTGSATISVAGLTQDVRNNGAWTNSKVVFTLAEPTILTIAFNITQKTQIETVAGFDNFKLVQLSEPTGITLKNELGGTSASLADFNVWYDDYTLEVEGTAGTKITVAADNISYTPEATGTVRFVKKDGIVYVFEGTSYKTAVHSRKAAYVYTKTLSDVDPVTGNTLENPSFETVGDKLADGKYKFGTPWTTSVTEAASGIRVMTSGSAQHGSYVLVWRGVGNNHFAQNVSSIKAYKGYKMYVRQIDGGNGFGDFRFGLGNAAGNIGYLSANITLGLKGSTPYNSVHEAVLGASPDIPAAGGAYFSCLTPTSARNAADNGSTNDPVSQIDWIGLVSSDDFPISGVSSASYVYGTAYVPATAKATYEAAKAAAEATIADATYDNVTGEERTNLQAAIDASVEDNDAAYNAATDNIQTAESAFTSALSHYQALIDAQDAVPDLAYASTASKAFITAVATSASDADAKVAAMTTDIRAYYESHALAEGVACPINRTSAIANPDAMDSNNGWTWTGSKNNPKNNEPWTDASGNSSHWYFDGGNWNGTNWTTTMSQTISIPAGTYLLTAKGRAASNTTLTMEVGSESVYLPHVGNSGNVFNNGWGDASVEFTTDGSDVEILVTATAAPQHEWFSVGDFRLVRIDATAAGTSDYTALNTAISEAEAHTLGFENGEYAPYNNVAALTLLAEAKAVNQSANNAKDEINALKTALEGASWTANDGAVDIVYNSDFSAGGWDPTGWTRTNGWGAKIPDYGGTTIETMKAAGASTGHAYYNQPGSMQYGNNGVYTMPLKANTIYTLTFKYASESANSNNSVTASVLNGEDGMAAIQYEKNGTKYDTENAFVTKTVKFVTGAAGNYVLTLANDGNTVMTDVSITKDANQYLEFVDGSAVPSYAPGTYPSVKITRTLAANKWATAVYPFAVSGVDNIAVLDSYNGETGEINFATAAASTANEPFFMKSNTDKSEISLSNVEVAAIAANPVATKSVASLKGVYASGNVPVSDEDNVRYVVSSNQLYKVDGVVSIKPFRAYFELTGTNQGARPTLRFDDVTAINAIEAEETEAGALKDGKYIIDNKVVIVKNGVKYGANGQKLN